MNSKTLVGAVIALLVSLLVILFSHFSFLKDEVKSLTDKVEHQVEYQKLEPRVRSVIISKTSSDTYLVSAIFSGLTSDKIIPVCTNALGSPTDYYRWPWRLTEEDMGYRSLATRRFTWTVCLFPDGAKFNGKQFLVEATTVDSSGHEHHVSSPVAILHNM